MGRELGRLKDTVANNLRLLRGKKTQNRWAKELGVNKMTVSAWERGLRWPKQSHLQRIAKKSHLKAGDLFRENLFVDGMVFQEPTPEYFSDPEVLSITQLIRRWKKEDPNSNVSQLLKQLHALPEEKWKLVFLILKTIT